MERALTGIKRLLKKNPPLKPDFTNPDSESGCRSCRRDKPISFVRMPHPQRKCLRGFLARATLPP